MPEPSTPQASTSERAGSPQPAPNPISVQAQSRWEQAARLLGAVHGAVGLTPYVAPDRAADDYSRDPVTYTAYIEHEDGIALLMDALAIPVPEDDHEGEHYNSCWDIASAYMAAYDTAFEATDAERADEPAVDLDPELADAIAAGADPAHPVIAARIIAWADAIMTAIDTDITCGDVPADVTSFNDLYGHVDPNTYLIDERIPYGTQLPHLDTDPIGERLADAVIDEVTSRLTHRATEHP
jgi:hypothetical protein